jgi:thiamine-phosphate pyrophosphorylase
MLARRSCQTGGVSGRLSTLQRARLYLVCDVHTDAFLDAVLRGGVEIVQLRAKAASDEAILVAARRYRKLCARHGALLILNDRPDLVEEAGADGVHVGQDDVPVASARELVGPDRIVGLSTHSPAQIDRAGELDVDYIGVGPVHATPTKPGRPAVGLELVRYAATHAARPCFAIGGIDPGTVDAVRGAGARRIAVVRALTDARDPEPVARALRRAISTEEQRVGAAQP